ncbi:MAG: bifunctional phosphoribosylaminoimidazolecarboxamide formyltransferase/IMP cyclohydrolase [Chloroflexota bacterium]
MTQKRALLSVADKRGIVAFAQQLHKVGVELVASGGTARQLSEAGLPVLAVEDLTGFPEILGGRVKTLHPAIHGGILARRTSEHLAELAEQKVAPIDLVVVNLYPFQETISQPDVSLAEAVEQIDIGGVALLRAAAKNHESVTVVCDPSDYDAVGQAFENGQSSEEERLQLAYKAFQHTANYDAAISGYLSRQMASSHSETESLVLPETLHLTLNRLQLNRYGENPHQQGGLYGYDGQPVPFTQLAGPEMGYNNWLDLDGSWQAAQDFPEPTVAIIKHSNPCGLASADTLAEAYDDALASDPVSAFGGIISVNRTFDGELAQRMRKLLVHVVAAPAYEPEALEMLRKKRSCRILVANPDVENLLNIRTIHGGLLVQERDMSEADMDPANWQIVSEAKPASEQLAEMAFAWRVARHVKSNAIVYATKRATVGVGAGQMSRVDSVMLAGHKAGERAKGAVMASDAFFPFADGIEAAAEHGIAAVVQPGGSMRDDEVIEAVNKLGLVMAFTDTRHFKH